MHSNDYNLLASADIYLLDQVFKDRFAPGIRILDAGCGGGRNIAWFLANGFDIHGVDADAGSISHLRHTAAHLAPHLPPDNFRIAAVEHLDYPDALFDAVLSIAVLHFARDDEHFLAMLHEMWRVLRRGGIFFARLASSIGIESKVRALGHGQYAVPDGSTRYLVDLDRLLELTQRLNAKLLEPIKTVNVQNMRCMTNWILTKA